MRQARRQVLPEEKRDALVRATVTACWEGSGHYRERLEGHGIEPGDIRSVADLELVPILLDKDDERQLQEDSRATEGHPFGTHLCVPPDQVVAVSATSGTTGTPTFYAFTKEDVAVTDALWARALTRAGVGRGTTVLHGFGLSMFLAGYPLARAVERMGAQIVPVGAEAGTEKLLATAELLGAEVLLATPSYVSYLVEHSPERLAALGLKAVICAGEPGAGLPAVRKRIESATGASLFDVLGGAHGIMNGSDGADPYAGMVVLGDDCSVQQLVDQETGAPVPLPEDGQPAYGVRVKTTLRWRAQPQLRTSVGDVYEMWREPGATGTVTRIRVVGRTDDLLIVKGVKVYPATIQDLVNGFRPRASGELRILVAGDPPRVEPPLRLRVERGPGAAASDDGALAFDLADAMHRRLSIRPEVEVVDSGQLKRTSHKSKLIEKVKK